MKSANWINKYWELQGDIDEIEWDIRKTRLEMKRWKEGGDLFIKNKFETVLFHQQRVGQALGSLENLLKEKLQLKKELIDLIDTFKGVENKILKMKYIDGMTLENIAYELGYTPGYIYNKHAQIVKSLKLLQKVSNK
ncbi:DUF1492 domain-containing protein [Sediminibacillus terrae]|uniref:DUF1492 domain-containing protein n=1 Tax=Sediminibacillus terrae TaxID=1562106 RepID=UPI00129590A9|nr:DUF1492 domain-containing protein [Sediminibacillus terrae]